MEKPVRQTKPSETAVVLLVLISGAVTVVIAVYLKLGVGIASLGIGLLVFGFLTLVWAMTEAKIKSQKLSQYLASLPPGQRFSALEEYYDGMLSRITETPEYKLKEKEFREKLEKRMKPILDQLENPGPLSFSARNRIEADIKELEKELRSKPTSEHNPALQRTRQTAPRR